MAEQETFPQHETRTEAEKAAEEERRVAQEIMEKLYDPLAENDWLVHYTRDLKSLNSILQRGIYSETFADLKSKFGDTTSPDIRAYKQGPDNISCWRKSTREADKNKVISHGFLRPWKENAGIMFVPLKNAPLDTGPLGEQGEITVKFKVQRRQFKLLVTNPTAIPIELQAKGRKMFIQTKAELKPLISCAEKYKLPITDYYYNLLYPLELPAKDLQQITIPRLRELAKTLGIEKLRAMSVEEIRSAAGALAEK